MTLCKINHVDIVTDTGSVRSIIVVAIYVKLLQLADSNLCDVRHQVIRNAVRVLAHRSGLMRTDRIEVAKQNHIPLRICKLNVCQNLLQHGLRPAVRVRALSLRALFRDRYKSRIAVYRCR